MATSNGPNSSTLARRTWIAQHLPPHPCDRRPPFQPGTPRHPPPCPEASRPTVACTRRPCWHHSKKCRRSLNPPESLRECFEDTLADQIASQEDGMTVSHRLDVTHTSLKQSEISMIGSGLRYIKGQVSETVPEGGSVHATMEL